MNAISLPIPGDANGMVKALSLWQPWGTAVMISAKHIETRDWRTDYRGPLVLHGAKRYHKGEWLEMLRDPQWLGALHPVLEPAKGKKGIGDILPYGCLLGVVDLVDIKPTNEFKRTELHRHRRWPEFPEAPVWTEAHMGDFGPGRFGWILENPRPFKEPLPWSGFQQLFNVPALTVNTLLGFPAP